MNPDPAMNSSDEEYLRTNVKRSVWVLGVLFVAMVLIGLYFEAELARLSQWFVDNTNIWGVLAFVMFNDTIISPIPPDVILVLVTKSFPYEDSLKISFLFGVASSFGGYIGWAFGRYVLKPTWFGEAFKNFIEVNHRRINRYGKLMVALGALTPVPYSMTCWAAGFLKMDFKDFVGVASLRVVRFLLYFKILVFSEKLSAWISTLF